MKCIRTKWFGPSSTKGSRIGVTDGDNRMFVRVPPELSNEEAHINAARQFCKMRGWTGDFIGISPVQGEYAFTWEGTEVKFTEYTNKLNGLCPICGKPGTVEGHTLDGRIIIVPCHDAVTRKQWEKR